jgi:uncharacterized protein
MNSVKRIILALCSVVILINYGHAQLLWKISGNGLEKPSYIFGTHHLAPLSIQDSITGLSKAKSETEQVCGEVVTSDLLKPEYQEKYKLASLMPNGKKVSDLLTKDQRIKVNKLLKDVIGSDLDAMPQLEQLSPFALTTVVLIVLNQQMIPGFDPRTQLDTQFQNEAIKSREKVLGLETTDFQLNVLFKSRTIERDAELLVCLADHLEQTKNENKIAYEAYMNQNLQKLLEISEEEMNNNCDSRPEEDAKLIYDRNNNWVNKMPEIMKKCPTLFVVGALHLPSEKGILNLLKMRGYSVEAIK